MKKIILILSAFIMSLSSFAQTYPSVSLNGGTSYSFSPGSFAGYPWGGIPNYSFNNSSAEVTLDITDYDPSNVSVGNEITVTFSRVGFGNPPLNWGSDNVTVLATLTPADFIAGAASITVNIPNGSVPVEDSTDYVSGYLYVLQVRGLNPGSDPNYVNFVSEIEENITLSLNTFSKSKLSGYSYNNVSDIVSLNESAVYSVYSITGSILTKGEGTEIGLSGLADGIYIIATDKGTTKIAKN